MNPSCYISSYKATRIQLKASALAKKSVYQINDSKKEFP